MARLRGKHYNDLLQRLMKLDDAIVDVGSSNVEDFLKMMQHYADSQEEFDLFVREVVREMTIKAGQKCTAIRRAFVPVATLWIGKLIIDSIKVSDRPVSIAYLWFVVAMFMVITSAGRP